MRDGATGSLSKKVRLKKSEHISFTNCVKTEICEDGATDWLSKKVRLKNRGVYHSQSIGTYPLPFFGNETGEHHNRSKCIKGGFDRGDYSTD